MLLRFAFALTVSAALLLGDSPGDITVHEWGTFTSIAGADGAPERWVSLKPPADLPCFVYHLSAQCIKCAPNTVRMETPVIYFYTDRPRTFGVHVDLPSGLITEWYPRASQTSRLQPGMTYGNDGNIEWPAVHVMPGTDPQFPNAGDASHYYAARETDAAPLQVGDEAEKVLFYRGIADFDIPLRPKFLPDGRLEVRATGDTLPFAMIFENRKGTIGFRVLRDLRQTAQVDMPLPVDGKEASQHELTAALESAGLYPKEAAAMIKTWSDSWFEEGMRIFWVVPRRTVDAVLPLRISPTPAVTARVFVGRVELLSPGTKQDISAALIAGDTDTLAKYGRFLRPFCDRLIHGNPQMAKTAAAFVYRASPDTNKLPESPCRVSTSMPTTDQR